MPNFTKVVVEDWNGRIGAYEIIHVTKRANNKYSCVFKNSNGDNEKQLVNESQLHCESEIDWD